MLAQDPENPMVQWRNSFIEHIIESNRDSLRLIIVVGSAARDTISTFIRSRGGEVPTIVSAKDAESMQMVAYKDVYAGGNRHFYYPVDGRGRNVLLDRGEQVDFKNRRVQEELIERARESERIARMTFLESGPYGNGIYDLGQFG